MVPADDAQEPEPTAPQITTGDQPPRASINNSARLTPMPSWLMHWWTPLLLAGILLAAGCFLASIWRMPLRPVSWWKINLYWPPSWPFNYHWPSKDAMTLCATIAGAGFAFSAWQQRSHENVTHEQNRFDDNQRNEFWQNRESAHALLNANSYAQQHEAVIRYIEMSDHINKFNYIFTNAGTHHQEAILTTLCAHVRKLGETEQTTLSELERAHLQEVIIKQILQRINGGPWNRLRVDLSETHFLSELTIKNLNTESIIYLNKSTFDHQVSIKAPSKITVYWEDAEFRGTLAITGTSTMNEPTKSIIHHDNLPRKINVALFQNVAFSKISGILPPIHNMPVVETSNEHGQWLNGRYFTNCYFIRRKDHLDTSHTLTLLYLSRTATQSHSICKAYLPEPYFWATINFQDHSQATTHNQTTEYYLQGCQFKAIQATLGKIASRISLNECLFSNSHNILFTSTFGPHLQHNGETDGIRIIKCTITSSELTNGSLPPINALYKGFTPHPPLIHFTTENRIICNDGQAPTIYQLTAEPMNAHTNSVLYATKIDGNNRTGKTPTFSWEYKSID